MEMKSEPTFEEVEPQADGFDVFDVETGNLVTSFDSREEFREHFSSVVSSVPDRSNYLMVFAVDAKGRTIATFPVDEILASY